MNNFKNLCLKSILLILLSIISVFSYFVFSVHAFSRADQTVKAEAAIVLGASVRQDQPSPVFRERINHAIQLYQKGLIGKIIFTGGQGENEQIPESESAKNYALNNGVNPKDIFCEYTSTTTYENLLEAKKIMDSEHIGAALVISDPQHMKRAMAIAHYLGITAYSSPTQTSAYKSYLPRLKFLVKETYFYMRFLFKKRYA